MKAIIETIIQARECWEASGDSEQVRDLKERAISSLEALPLEEKDEVPEPMLRWLMNPDDSSSEATSAINDKLNENADGPIAHVPARFRELANLVRCKWALRSYDETVFHEVATQAVLESEIHQKMDPYDPARWAALTPHIASQFDPQGRFGQPPITVYRCELFHIDVLYWMDSTTSVHEHSFCGSFSVMGGSSIHTLYRLENERRINARLFLGDLQLKSCEVLKAGDVRPIIAGKGTIHSLFHLDHPSVSLVVRAKAHTMRDQCHFYRPGMGVTSFPDHEEKLRARSFRLLCLAKQPGYLDDLQAFLNSCPEDEFVRLLLSLGGILDDPDYLPFTLTQIVRDRRYLLREVIAAMKQESRSGELISFRTQTSDPDERFLLALMMNLDNRDMLLEFVQQRWPDAPVRATLKRLFAQMFGRSKGKVELNLDSESCDRYADICAALLEGKMIHELDPAYAEEAFRVSENPILKPFLRQQTG